MKTDSDAIPTATLTFVTMPDSDLSLLTLLGIDRQPELNMSATEPEVEITCIPECRESANGG